MNRAEIVALESLIVEEGFFSSADVRFYEQVQSTFFDQYRVVVLLLLLLLLQVVSQERFGIGRLFTLIF